MTQHEHHRNACTKFAVHGLDIFNFDSTEDLLRRHLGEFGAAKQVSAQPLEMAADEATQFDRRALVTKGNRDVAFTLCLSLSKEEKKCFFIINRKRKEIEGKKN